jgi:general secretion pathway protein A
MADATDATIEVRLARIEARLDEQEAALRRVLTMLVEWIEDDGDDPRPAHPE